MQVMIEGPGHVPMQLIKENMDLQLSYCREARSTRWDRSPPTSRRLRSHHERDRRGDDWLVRHRDAVLRHAQGAPGLPDKDDVKDGIIAYKIAAHAADSPRGIRAHRAGTTRSKARFEFRWEDQFNLASTPTSEGVPRRDPARRAKLAHFCSMCGPHFCSMITQDVRDYAAKRGRQDALEKGLKEKSEEFAKQGGEIYTGCKGELMRRVSWLSLRCSTDAAPARAEAPPDIISPFDAR